MAFAEGSANDWLALAMVDGHGVANATGALVFGIFVAAMTVGRVFGVYLLDRFGRVPVLRVSAVFAGIGLVVVIFAPVAWLACIGVVLWVWVPRSASRSACRLRPMIPATPQPGSVRSPPSATWRSWSDRRWSALSASRSAC